MSVLLYDMLCNNLNEECCETMATRQTFGERNDA